MYEFSLAGYNNVVTALKDAGYTFCMFDQIAQHLTAQHPFVVLRHDIDISLRPALEIAQVEHEQGVQATYFVTLHSPFYNALSKPNNGLISQIHELGHAIALHIDLTIYGDDCTKALAEIDTFIKFYPYATPCIASIHSPIDLERMPIQNFEQFRRVYEHMFSKELAYISDSTGRWRFGHPLESEAFMQRKPLQLLTHPIWWVQDGKNAKEQLEDFLYKEYLNSLALAHDFLPKLFGARQIQTTFR